MNENKKVVADGFIVYSKVISREIYVFNDLNDALKKSFSSDDYEIMVLDKHGKNITMDFWKEEYYNNY